MPVVKLKQLPGEYSVSRLPETESIPSWADGVGFVSISRSDEELSIVCRSDRVPVGVASDARWTCIKLQGPFAFDETGIVLSVIEPLSSSGIGIFVVSTYDGDHLLVKTESIDRAHRLLTDAGHLIAKNT